MAANDPHPTEEELAERGRSLVASVADVRAPAELRSHLAAERPAGARRRLALPVLGGLAAAAAIALVLVLALGGDDPSGPSFADAAALTATPTQDGIERVQVDGRDATTIGYTGPAGQTIGYTIVEGPPLDAPDGRDVERAGTTYTVVHDGDRTLVTWVRGGRTCIVGASDEVSDARLVNLAASF